MRLNFQTAMLTTLLAIACCVCQSAFAATNVPPQALLFRNGDILLGQLESISSEKSVIWKRGDVLEPIDFSGSNISEIRFPAKKESTVTGTNFCRVNFRNDDSIEGTLLELDAEKLTLQTAFAGKLVFPRKVVQSLEPLPPESDPVFTGPSGLEGWTIGKVTVAAGDAGQWQYTNGAFYATQSASIARDVKLPDVARIQFDLAWKGMLQSAVALYTSHMHPVALANKDNEPDFGGFYSLQLNSFVATLMPVKKNEPLRYLGQVAVPAFTEKNNARIEVLANKKRASVALLVDGVLIKEWIDTDGFAGTGTGLRFVHQGGQEGSRGSARLSNIRVSEWNGKMATRSTNIYVGKDDLASLANGDRVSGELQSFRAGKMTFATSGTKLDVPMNRIADLYFANNGKADSSELGSNVRGFLHNGGAVTFKIESWNGDTVTGTSPNFGRAAFATSAFERIELNSFPTNKLAF